VLIEQVTIKQSVYTQPGFWWRNLTERDHLEYPGVNGRIILRWIFKEVGCKGMDWIDLTQDRDRWRAFVNAVKILTVP
jgi:hypothetical protein